MFTHAKGPSKLQSDTVASLRAADARRQAQIAWTLQRRWSPVWRDWKVGGYGFSPQAYFQGGAAAENAAKSGAMATGGLSLSSPSDACEQEADALATRVLSAPTGEAGAGRASATNTAQVQRQCGVRQDEEQAEEKKRDEDMPTGKIQRRGHGEAKLSRGMATAVRGLGGGEPLRASERQFFEGRFGHDFSRVRVHTDGRAAHAARALNADAFTLRNEVAFAEGRYQVGSETGRHLLAHELAHVIQQGQATPLAEAESPPARMDSAHPLGGVSRAVAGALIQRSSAATEVNQCGGEEACAEEPASSESPLQVTTTGNPAGVMEVKVEKLTVLRVDAQGVANPQVDIKIQIQEHMVYVWVRRSLGVQVELDPAGVAALGGLGYDVVPGGEILPERGLLVQGGDVWGAPSAAPSAPPTAKAAPQAVRKPAPQPAAQPTTEALAAKPTGTTPATPAKVVQGPQPDAKPTEPTLDSDLQSRRDKVTKNLAAFFNPFWQGNVVEAFQGLAPDEMLRLQDALGEDVMTAVFAKLSPYRAALIGSWGPVNRGLDKLNEQRAEFIVDIRDWGSTKDTFYHWLFENMTNADIAKVLKQVAQKKRLKDTVLSLPGLRDELIARGVDASLFTEEKTTVLEGVGRGLGNMWSGAWSRTIFGDGPSLEFMDLPKAYQDRYVGNLVQAGQEAMQPGNLARGIASEATLGASEIPFGIYEAGKATVQAAGDIAEGRGGEAAEKLTPVVLSILTMLVGHKVAKASAAKTSELTVAESRAAGTSGLATAESGAAGAKDIAWSVRPLGKTAEGLDRYVASGNGEYVELLVDQNQRTIQARHMVTGETLSYENGKITRGPAGLLPPAQEALTAEQKLVKETAATVPKPPTRQVTGPTAQRLLDEGFQAQQDGSFVLQLAKNNVTISIGSDNLYHVVIQSSSGAVVAEFKEFDLLAKYGKKPLSSMAIQAHHGCQDEIMKQWFGKYGYDGGEAPAIWLRDSTGNSPHGIITHGIQNPQKGSRLSVDPSYGQARKWAVADLKTAGVPDGVIAAYIDKVDRYFKNNILPNIPEADRATLLGDYTP